MKKKILAVDDESDSLDLICTMLLRAGFVVVSAANGAEALEIARTQRPDLIILDVMIPDISGLEVLKKLKFDADTQKIPVLLLTALSKELDRIVGLELGADDYVVKPFSPQEVILRVKILLGLNQLPEPPSTDD